jgi:hypothetical protein
VIASPSRASTSSRVCRSGQAMAGRGRGPGHAARRSVDGQPPCVYSSGLSFRCQVIILVEISSSDTMRLISALISSTSRMLKGKVVVAAAAAVAETAGHGRRLAGAGASLHLRLG